MRQFKAEEKPQSIDLKLDPVMVGSIFGRYTIVVASSGYLNSKDIFEFFVKISYFVLDSAI